MHHSTSLHQIALHSQSHHQNEIGSVPLMSSSAFWCNGKCNAIKQQIENWKSKLKVSVKAKSDSISTHLVNLGSFFVSSSFSFCDLICCLWCGGRLTWFHPESLSRHLDVKNEKSIDSYPFKVYSGLAPSSGLLTSSLSSTSSPSLEERERCAAVVSAGEPG